MTLSGSARPGIAGGIPWSSSPIPSSSSTNGYPNGTLNNVGNVNANYRFNCNPMVTNPVDTQMAAQACSYFLPHVSSFIVEYAGDFLSQDTAGTTNGTITDVKPDGQIDYYIDSAGNKQIRWYGMPRCTDGTGQILGDIPSQTIANLSKGQVLPLAISGPWPPPTP